MLKADQKRKLKKWNASQTDKSFFDWYKKQKENSEEFNAILLEKKFGEGNNLTVEDFYRISDLLTEYLGNTALSIRGKESIFEKNPIDVVNIRLRELLFGEMSLAVRVERFIELENVGTMTVSQFLCLYNHKKYPFYAGFMEGVFRRILLLDQDQFALAKNQAKKEFIKSEEVKYSRTVDYFTFFVILREIKDLLKLESYLQVQNLLWRIYRPEDGGARKESGVPDSKIWWIEKSYLKTHKRFGTVLASPQKRTDGIARHAYNNMRSVNKGDVVLHLVDNKMFIGSSIVEKEYESVPYVDHRGKRPGYLVHLSNYEKFDYPIMKEEILNKKYKDKLLDLLDEYYLFYNRDLNLNQGAYLTEAPQELVRILNKIYKEKSGQNLPHFSDRGVKETLSVSPLVDESLTMPSEEDINKAIEKIQETLLIDSNSIREIITHLVSGKNVIISGPIGTGKTHLARLIPIYVWQKIGGYYPFVYTATGDWTTHDVIGGIIPKLGEDQKIVYRIHKGCVYETISRNYKQEDGYQKRCTFNFSENNYQGVWLIIDEFNRANIDKAFGEMFTAIEYCKLKVPTMEEEKAFDEINIPKDFRIIGTLNTFDKHYLFKLSDALKRRFAFVEILPPSNKLAEKEKFYALKRSLEKLTPIIDKSKIAEINSRLKLDTKEIDSKGTKSKMFEIFDAAYDIVSYVRRSKNLGTAILISIYKFILVDKQYNEKDYEKSLDIALRSYIIPHLENVTRWSLETIRAFCCENLVEFLKNRERMDSNFTKYVQEFEKLLRYLGKDQISRRISAYKNNEIVDEHWLSYDPWINKKRPSLPQFRSALTRLIAELEII